MSRTLSPVKKKFLLAVAVNSVMLLISLLFSVMQFGTNDDRDISNLLGDVYGSGNGYYIPFVNYIFCRAMALVYQVLGNSLNWYVLISLVLSFLSLTLISFLLLLRSENLRTGTVLTFVLVAILYRWHYVIFQFTQNATLFTMTGALLFIDYCLYRGSHGFLRMTAAVCFTVFGCLLRSSSMYFVFPYLALFLLLELFLGKKPEGIKAWLSERWKVAAAIALCCLLIFGSVRYDQWVYGQDPDLQEYVTDNDLRGELLDYGFPSYEENAEAFSSLGITEEDMMLMSSQCYLDRSVFSHEALLTMVEMKETQALSYSFENLRVSSLRTVVGTVLRSMCRSVYWWILLGLFVVVVLTRNKKNILLYIGSVLLALVMMWYFLSVGRMPDRVLYSITAPLLVSALYIIAGGDGKREKASEAEETPRRFSFRRWISGEKFRGTDMAAGLILALICLCSAASVGFSLYTDSRTERTDTYEAIIDFAEAHPDSLVLLDRPTVTEYVYAGTVTPLTMFSEGSHRNVCYLGGWTCWSPANLSSLQRFGTDNVFRSIGEGMEVYLIDQFHFDAELSFIRRHYNTDVQMELVGYIGDTDIGIYRFYLPEVIE